MTPEEYAMLRRIAAADCTDPPNFDPALLMELLDVYDAAYNLFADKFTPLGARINDLQRAVNR